MICLTEGERVGDLDRNEGEAVVEIGVVSRKDGEGEGDEHGDGESVRSVGPTSSLFSFAP